MEPIQIDVTLEDVEVIVNRDGGRSGLVFYYDAPDVYSDANFWFSKEVLEGMLAKLNDAMEKDNDRT